MATSNTMNTNDVTNISDHSNDAMDFDTYADIVQKYNIGIHHLKKSMYEYEQKIHLIIAEAKANTKNEENINNDQTVLAALTQEDINRLIRDTFANERITFLKHAIAKTKFTEDQFNAATKMYENECFKNDWTEPTTVDNPRCTTFKMNGSTIHLVGTCHYSKRSQQDVKDVIRLTQPHSICVENCVQRYPGHLNALADQPHLNAPVVIERSIIQPFDEFCKDVYDIIGMYSPGWWDLPVLLAAPFCIPYLWSSCIRPLIELCALDSKCYDFRNENEKKKINGLDLEGAEFIIAATSHSRRRFEPSVLESEVPIGVMNEFLIDRNISVLLKRCAAEILSDVNERGLFQTTSDIYRCMFDEKTGHEIFDEKWDKFMNKLWSDDMHWENLVTQSASGENVETLQKDLILYRLEQPSSDEFWDSLADCGDEINDLLLSFPLFDKKIGKSFLQDRNDHMTDNIQKICEARPNQTIAVVIGAAHIPGILSNLKKIEAGTMPKYVIDTPIEDLQKNLKQFDIEYPRVSSFLHKATRGNVEPVEAFTTSFVPHSMTDYAAIGGVATAVVVPYAAFGAGLNTIKNKCSGRIAAAFGVGTVAAYGVGVAWERTRFSKAWESKRRLQRVALEMDDPERAKRQYQIENSISIDNSNKDVNKDANILSTSLIKSKK